MICGLEPANYVRQNRAVLDKAGRNIRALREDDGWSQEELGRRAGGLNKGTVNTIELGANTKIDTIAKLAKALRVPFPALFTEEASDLVRQRRTGEHSDVELDPTDVRSGYERDAIPVIAEGEATPEGLIWTTTVVRNVVIEYIAKPFDLDDKDAYGLLVIGDSMEPAFRKGHRLIASPNTPIEDGDEAYVQLVSGERLIKVVHRTETGWRLESINPKYPPRDVPADQVATIHTIVWSKRRRPGFRTLNEDTRKRMDR